MNEKDLLKSPLDSNLWDDIPKWRLKLWRIEFWFEFKWHEIKMLFRKLY